MPTNVLQTDKASAPASSAALASKVISVTFGDNFTIKNFSETLRTELTTCFKTIGSELNCNPPLSTLGQDTFISKASIRSSFDKAEANSTYCGIVSTKKFTMKFVL